MQSFFALIDHLNVCADHERSKVEELVWGTFGVERAIMALDMSQFSLSVRRSGILAYLGQIRRMQVTTGPIVRDCGGEVIKYEADNLMAVFPDGLEAVSAAVRINEALPASQGAPAVSIGIDYGRFLMIPGEDCYGDPVNVAYKLGEDLARPGEILITSAVRERLGARCAHELREQQVSISGLEFIAYGVAYA
jgi:class 3 adenylate cyclase